MLDYSAFVCFKLNLSTISAHQQATTTIITDHGAGESHGLQAWVVRPLLRLQPSLRVG